MRAVFRVFSSNLSNEILISVFPEEFREYQQSYHEAYERERQSDKRADCKSEISCKSCYYISKYAAYSDRRCVRYLSAYMFEMVALCSSRCKDRCIGYR